MVQRGAHVQSQLGLDGRVHFALNQHFFVWGLVLQSFVASQSVARSKREVEILCDHFGLPCGFSIICNRHPSCQLEDVYRRQLSVHAGSLFQSASLLTMASTFCWSSWGWIGLMIWRIGIYSIFLLWPDCIDILACYLLFLLFLLGIMV